MSPAERTRADFERLVQQHQGIVRKIAFGYAKEEGERRDLMQEILLQLWRAFPRYSPERPFSTWMYRVALNVAISSLRRNTRPGRQTVQFDETAHDVAAENPEPDERVALLRRVIADCAPLDRALLLLYLDDCSYREIAGVLGLTETNVATKLNRLKDQLRKKLSVIT